MDCDSYSYKFLEETIFGTDKHQSSQISQKENQHHQLINLPHPTPEIKLDYIERGKGKKKIFRLFFKYVKNGSLFRHTIEKSLDAETLKELDDQLNLY